MLAADKLQLQSAFRQQATALKEKEFNLHHSNMSESLHWRDNQDVSNPIFTFSIFSFFLPFTPHPTVTVGTQAAVLAGLDITMFIEFNPPHDSVWVRPSFLIVHVPSPSSPNDISKL
jgi:hypothetical protein